MQAYGIWFLCENYTTNVFLVIWIDLGASLKMEWNGENIHRLKGRHDISEFGKYVTTRKNTFISKKFDIYGDMAAWADYKPSLDDVKMLPRQARNAPGANKQKEPEDNSNMLESDMLLPPEDF